MDDNREVGLITANAAIHAQALAWFNALWAQATPWTVSTTSASSSAGSSSAPYLPDGETMAQVTRLWGRAQSILHNTYDGHPQIVWVYAEGWVDFQGGRVTDVQRASS